MSALLPRLSTIPPSIGFTDALAQGVFETCGDASNPLALADILILLPTRRAVRALTDAFGRIAEARGLGALLLPRIHPIGDVDEESLMLEGFALAGEANLSIPPAVGELDRAFELAQLVGTLMTATGDPTTPDRAVALAFDLAKFLDASHTEHIALDALEDLAPERFAKHWQKTIRFLDIVRKAWPTILKAGNRLDPADRRNRLLQTLGQRWQASPPNHPVIAAGTTGSIPATADLLKVISTLERGHIVLPGIDLAMSTRAWGAIEPSHPQFGLSALIDHLEVERASITQWPFGASRAPTSRQRLINEALRPSAATDEWVETAKEIAQPDACEGLRFLVAQHTAEEARAIALLLRETIETPDRTAALVTPDRGLARRVSAELKRFGLNIDDSAGVPLDQTPPATFLLHLSEALANDWAAVPLLALLKHPLFRAGETRGALRGAIDALEKNALRGVRKATGLEGLHSALEKARKETSSKNRQRGLDAAITLLETLTKAAAPLQTASTTNAALTVWVEAHLAAANRLASDETGSSDELWRGVAGEDLSEFLNDLSGAKHAPGSLTAFEYANLLRGLMARRLVRNAEGVHPRLFIWGPLEARLQQADLVVLGSLVEGVWPAEASVDAWLSRPMRKRLGFSSPERQIGLAAHDFAQLAASPEVVLSRAEKVEGKPAVPSRWWLRLENLLTGADLPKVHELCVPHVMWARLLDTSEGEPTPVKPPLPTAPLEARPRELSVTAIENWIRDPYSIYARYILKLKALEEIDREAGPADRGSLIHNILEDFVKAFPKRLPEQARDKLIKIGERHFEVFKDVPQVQAIWWPRFLRIVDWILEFEPKRRETIDQVLAEREATLTFSAGSAPFTLKARADRIDLYTDGTIGIVDYKTGAIPKKKACETGLSPQVTLEAAMAARGAFGTSVPDRVSSLLYIGLKGGAEPGELRAIAEDEDRTTELAEEAFANLKELIEAFDDPDRPYPSQPRPRLANVFGDYDHLARRREWSVGTKDEGGDDG